jgi:hypothetical protein
MMYSDYCTSTVLVQVPGTDYSTVLEYEPRSTVLEYVLVIEYGVALYTTTVVIVHVHHVHVLQSPTVRFYYCMYVLLEYTKYSEYSTRVRVQ